MREKILLESRTSSGSERRNVRKRFIALKSRATWDLYDRPDGGIGSPSRFDRTTWDWSQPFWTSTAAQFWKKKKKHKYEN